jgi:hypothetical protein
VKCVKAEVEGKELLIKFVCGTRWSEFVSLGGSGRRVQNRMGCASISSGGKQRSVRTFEVKEGYIFFRRTDWSCMEEGVVVEMHGYRMVKIVAVRRTGLSLTGHVVMSRGTFEEMMNLERRLGEVEEGMGVYESMAMWLKMWMKEENGEEVDAKLMKRMMDAVERVNDIDIRALVRVERQVENDGEEDSGTEQKQESRVVDTGERDAVAVGQERVSREADSEDDRDDSAAGVLQSEEAGS